MWQKVTQDMLNLTKFKPMMTCGLNGCTVICIIEYEKIRAKCGKITAENQVEIKTCQLKSAKKKNGSVGQNRPLIQTLRLGPVGIWMAPKF